MADTLESTGNYLPKDLRITAQPDAVDKDKFKVVATGLKISEAYVFQFQYVFEDGKTSEWSPSYSLLTNAESVPTAPSGTSVEGGAGFIKVSLPTFPANALRVDVKIAGGIFGDGTKVADSFTAAGTKTIAAPGSSSPGLAYTVTLLTITPSKISGQTTTATTVYVTDPAATLAVTAPEDPFAPTVRAGLASVIVEWSGKKSDGTDLITTGFSGAKVHIGTSSGFTPSADNWVHTLNFANGSNRVSIGVGSIIDKTAGTTLAYGTPYYIKLVTVNANGVASGTVSASNNPVTVAKLPASEISTGILTADASITAGVDGGSRVVMSGGPSPFIIYGTNGTTKLLEFIGGATGTLSITGSGIFTGDISGATGTLKNALNVGTYSALLPGGYPFSVNASGYLYANSGKIGGWTLVGSTLESSTVGANNSKIKLDPDSPIIALMQNGVNKVTISADSGIIGPQVVVQNQSRTSFKLGPDGDVSLAGSIFADTGSIAGWTLNNNYIQRSNTYTDIFGSTGTLTTTLGSNATISLSSTNAPAFYSYGGDPALSVSNASNKISIGPNGLEFEALSTINGVTPGKLYLSRVTGDYNFNIYWTGTQSAFDPGSYSSFKIKWLNYSTSGERLFHLASSTYDTIPQFLRPLVIDSDGTQYLGATSYFSTTQQTTPSSGTGQNGDLYYSTA
jgi:hypothetical protein